MSGVQTLRRHGVTITVALLFVVSSLGVVLATRRLYHQSSPPQRPIWKPRAAGIQDNGKDQRPLSEKARETGRYAAVEYPPDLREFANLDDLVKKSDAIVIGKALHNTSQVSPDGKTITIDYEMQVEHVFKGIFATSKPFVVSLPGGLVRFSDGTSAEIGTPWFKKLINGSTYLLFLNQKANRPWVPTGGPRGVFEIPTTSANRKVTSQSLLQGDPMAVYNDTDVITFLRSVRTALTAR